MEKLWIIGAGGHAKVVIDAARASGCFEPVGVLDDDPARRETTVLGVRVRGAIRPDAAGRFGIERAVIAIGSNRIRAEIAARLEGCFSWATIVHPAAVLGTGVEVGLGSVVFAGAILQPDTTIGRHVIINTACSIDHDGSVGDFAHVAPGVHLAGGVRLGEGSFLGIGACALPGSVIGDWATVGAGGVVTSNIPAGVVAKGVPARYAVVQTPSVTAAGNGVQ
jgi:sugar O-acyltransferase (sialic acid O-acetyltransferase NeuD family)